VVEGEKLIPETRGSILEGMICYTRVENAQITPWLTVTTVCFENLLNKNKVIEHVALTNNTTDLKYSL